MAAVQQDPELPKLQSLPSSLILKVVPLPTSDTTIVCNTSMGVPHPFVPVKFHRTLFNSLYSLSHPGIPATQCLVTANVLLLLGMSGLVLMPMSGSGHDPVCSASDPRSSDIQLLHYPHSQLPMPDLTTSTLISWAHSLLQKATLIS